MYGQINTGVINKNDNLNGFWILELSSAVLDACAR